MGNTLHRDAITLARVKARALVVRGLDWVVRNLPACRCSRPMEFDTIMLNGRPFSICRRCYRRVAH